MTAPSLSRRAVLRGMGGIALALPLLDAMRPRSAGAAPPHTPRFLLGFGGFSLATDHDSEPPLLLPQGYGPDYQLHPAAAGLEDLHDDLLWVSGLRIPKASRSDAIPPDRKSVV